MIALEYEYYDIAKLLLNETGHFSRSGKTALFYVVANMFKDSEKNYELYKNILQKEPYQYFMPEYNNCLGSLI